MSGPYERMTCPSQDGGLIGHWQQLGLAANESSSLYFKDCNH